MNYEEKYKQALERAKAINEGKTTGAVGQTVCEYIFPELMEKTEKTDETAENMVHLKHKK